MAIHIGTSGWSYDHWQNVLYPPRTPSRERLRHYIAHGYTTVEVNNSYYRWPTDETFAAWRDLVPEHFRLTIKASRGLTHVKKLREPEGWIERIDASLRILGERRGVLLVQLPPSLGYDRERLACFLRCLPPDLQTAVEFRHESWDRDDVYALLEEHGVAYCVMSGARLPCVLRATAPFVYVRLHGPDPNFLYGGSYSDDDLRWWAERVREWHDGQNRDVWIYFNNDGEGNAVRNADTLKRLLG